MAKRKYKRLHYEDRQTIETMSKQGSSVSDIAEVLGTHRDTIYREFKRCNATLKTYTAVAGAAGAINQKKTKEGVKHGTYKNNTTRGTIKRFGIYQRNSELLKWNRQHRCTLLGDKEFPKRKDIPTLLRYGVRISRKCITILQSSGIYRS